MAQARIDIVVNDSSLDSLETQLQSLNQRIKQVGVGSAEFKTLATEIRGVQGQLNAANNALKGFDIGAVVGNASKIFGGLGAGVAGISALFIDAEDSTEKLAETQVKLAAAFGLVQTAEAIATIATSVQIGALRTQLVETEAVTAAKLKLAAAEVSLTEAQTISGEAIDFAEDNLRKATEGLNAAEIAAQGTTKSVSTFGKVLAFITNPITIVVAALTALYFIVEELRAGFEEAAVISQYGAAIDDLGSIVDSSIGSFSSLTTKVIQYQTAIRTGILSDEERARAQKLLRAELEKGGVAQENVNSILTNGTDAINEYLKALPKLIQQQVLVTALTKEYEKLLELELDASASAPSLFQTAGNFLTSFGNSFAFTIKQFRTQSENFSEVSEETADTIEAILKKLEENVTASPDLIKKAVLGEDKDQKETVAQVRDITNEINKLIRASREEQIRNTKTDYDLERSLLNDKLKNDIEDAKMANKAIQDDDKVSSEQKVLFAKATDGEILRLTSEFVREKKRLNDEEAKDYIENLESIYDEHEDLYQAYLDRETGRIQTVSRLEEAALTRRFLQGEISERKFQEEIFDSRQKALEKEEEARTRTILDKRKLVQEELNKLEGETGEAASQRRKELLNEESQLNKDLLDVQKEYLADSEELQNERVDTAKQRRAEQFNEFVQAISDIAIGSLQIYNDFLQSQIDLLGIQTQSQLDELDERIAAGQKQFAVRQKQLESSTLLSAKARANAIAQLEEQRLAEEIRQAAERERIEKEAARQGLEIQGKQNKASLAISIAQAIAQAASGIATATAQAPLTFGASLALIAPIAVALAAAIGAFKAQGNVIDAQTKALGFADGGFVSGSGTGTSDSIPARLSNGEFVVNATSTAQNLPLLEAINSTSGEGASLTLLLNKLSGQLDNLQKQPVKAYVVTSELDQVTKTQDYINRRASL